MSEIVPGLTAISRVSCWAGLPVPHENGAELGASSHVYGCLGGFRAFPAYCCRRRAHHLWQCRHHRRAPARHGVSRSAAQTARSSDPTGRRHCDSSRPRGLADKHVLFREIGRPAAAPCDIAMCGRLGSGGLRGRSNSGSGASTPWTLLPQKSPVPWSSPFGPSEGRTSAPSRRCRLGW